MWVALGVAVGRHPRPNQNALQYPCRNLPRFAATIAGNLVRQKAPIHFLASIAFLRFSDFLTAFQSSERDGIFPPSRTMISNASTSPFFFLAL